LIGESVKKTKLDRFETYGLAYYPKPFVRGLKIIIELALTWKRILSYFFQFKIVKKVSLLIFFVEMSKFLFPPGT
jgi:hypothetical protein